MYKCSYCGLSLTRWGSYLEHVRTVHEAEGDKGMRTYYNSVVNGLWSAVRENSWKYTEEEHILFHLGTETSATPFLAVWAGSRG
jgi:hypothetical protein